MFLRVQPVGVNVPNDEDRMPVWRVTSGDDWTLSLRLTVPKHPAMFVTPDNSKVTFTLAEDRFSHTPLWTGTWNAGILPADVPGLVSVRIPDAITNTLRRGAYAFSVTVANHFGRDITTVISGTLQVEYEPTSPMHNIPYRSAT